MATGPGIRFTETMRGFATSADVDTYDEAAADGRRAGSRLEFTVTITIDSLDAMLADPNHAGRITGTVSAPTLSSTPLRVLDGEFNLFASDPTSVNTTRMKYRMSLASDAGEKFRLDGFKVIRKDRGDSIWRDTTTLFVTVTREDGSVAAKGILEILPADFMKQMTTMEAIGAANPVEGLRAIARFGQFFAGVLFDTYGGVFARTTEMKRDVTPRKKRPLKMSAPEVYDVVTSDGVAVRLTRYNGGKQGPVLLAPGFGTSTLAFTIDTVDTNLPEFLFADGYDVWLFDYRASPALPSSRTQFTLDDIATKDWPAAVAKVRAVSGAASVQVMAHCVGSMTFLMAMLSGLQGVRSAVCSALSLFPESPIGNRVKAKLDLGTLLRKFGIDMLTTSFDPGNPADRFIDQVLRMFPSRESCPSAVCRRILGIYGEVYKHEMLNEPTHAAIHEMFGVANVTAFDHITRMIREGHVVDAQGRDVYMSNISRLAVPITFLHGQENRLFLPEGTEKTFKLLAQRNGAALYQRITVPVYAHMDCFMARNSATDIFPLIVNALQSHTQLAPQV